MIIYPEEHRLRVMRFLIVRSELTKSPMFSRVISFQRLLRGHHNQDLQLLRDKEFSLAEDNVSFVIQFHIPHDSLLLKC